MIKLNNYSVVSPKDVWKVGLFPWAGMKLECWNVPLVKYGAVCDPGVELLYLKMFEEIFKLRLHFVVSPTVGCGKLLPNGSYTGVMEMLRTGKVDIIGNWCVLNVDRGDQNFSRFSLPAMQDKQHFLIKAPSTVYTYRPDAPFQYQIWIAITCFTIFMILIQIVILKVRLQIEWSTSCRYTFGLVNEPNFDGCLSIDILSAVSQILLGIILTSYSTYIAGVLFVPLRRAKPFKSNADLAPLVERGDYKLISNTLPFNYPICYHEGCQMFRNGVEKFGSVYHEMNSNKASETNSFFNRILFNTNNDKLVFIREKIWMDFYLQNYKNASLLWLMDDELIDDTRYSYFYGKNFTLAKQFNLAVTRIGDFKSNNVYKRQYIGGGTSEIDHVIDTKIVKGYSSRIVVTMTVIVGPIKAYSVGVVTSVLTFILEMFVKPGYFNAKSNGSKFIRQTNVKKNHINE